MKGISYNLMISWFPTWEFESSRLIPKMFEMFVAEEVFMDFDETEEELKEDDDDINYD